MIWGTRKVDFKMDPRTNNDSDQQNQAVALNSKSFSENSPNQGDQGRHQAYWKANLRLLSKLLLIWFLVSFGCGIIFAPSLNQYKLIGTDFPLGFWFAQQGAIYVFVVLIFAYIKAMDRLDHEYEVGEERSEENK